MCADYPVCGLSMHDRKLLVTNDEGGKEHDQHRVLEQNAQYKQNHGLFT